MRDMFFKRNAFKGYRNEADFWRATYQREVNMAEAEVVKLEAIAVKASRAGRSQWADFLAKKAKEASKRADLYRAKVKALGAEAEA